MDYDSIMLNIYFNEKEFDDDEKESLLDKNPFNKDYVHWLDARENNGKAITQSMKKRRLISMKTKLAEITEHSNDTISSHLMNDNVILLKDDIKSIRFLPNHTILMRGKFPFQETLISKLYESQHPFIVAEATRDKRYYERIREYYMDLRNTFPGTYFIEDIENERKVCILKSR